MRAWTSSVAPCFAQLAQWGPIAVARISEAVVVHRDRWAYISRLVVVRAGSIASCARAFGRKTNTARPLSQ